MDPSSSSSFRSLLNSSTTSPESHGAASGYNLQFQNFFPPHLPTNPRPPPPPPYGPNQPPQYPHHFNPYGVPPRYQQFPTSSSGYHGIPLHDDVGQYDQGGFRFFGMAGDPSSPVGSAALCGGVGGSASRGDESGSPISIPHTIHGVPVINEEQSEEYNMGYYLTDGIYPEWATFVKSVPRPLSVKDKLFAKKQAAVRKDMECAFGVLQARFAIIRNPARMWEREALSRIMYACIILHNMIVEDERDSYGSRNDAYDYDQTNSTPLVNYHPGPINEFARMLEINTSIHDRSIHRRLKADLTEHTWQRSGGIQAEDSD